MTIARNFPNQPCEKEGRGTVLHALSQTIQRMFTKDQARALSLAMLHASGQHFSVGFDDELIRRLNVETFETTLVD